MRIRERRINLQGSGGFLTRRGNALMSRMPAEMRQDEPVVSKSNVSHAKRRIQINRLLVASPRKFQRLRRDLGLQMPAFQIRLVSCELGRIPLWTGVASKLDPQSLADSCRNFILHGKDIAQLAVIPLRPNMGSVCGRNQLRCHANAASRPAHATFENRTYTESFCDDADVLFFTAEGERRGTGDHFQPGNLREQ